MMENIEQLIKQITNRLLEELHQRSVVKQVYLIGSKVLADDLIQKGYAITEEAECADEVIADGFTIDSLLRIASLTPLHMEELAVIDCLLRGKTVKVVLDSLLFEQYKQTAKSFLYRELTQQKSKLEKYGIQFLERSQLLISLGSQLESTVNRSQNTEHKSGRKVLITEPKLRALGLVAGDEFVLEKGMIITALAKDYLKRNKISIIK